MTVPSPEITAAGVGNMVHLYRRVGPQPLTPEYQTAAADYGSNSTPQRHAPYAHMLEVN